MENNTSYWYFDDNDNIYDKVDATRLLYGGTVDNDRMFGYGGDDVLAGGMGDDTLDGGDGNDELSGNQGKDQLFGGNGGDNLLGGDGDDILDGGAGDDVLDGEAGSDTMKGGAGNDSYWLWDQGDVIVEAANAGYDTVFSSLDGYMMAANLERLYLGGLYAISAYGNAQNNLIYGNNNPVVFDNHLWGGAGNDTLVGSIGNDWLYGDAGNDVLIGEKRQGELTSGDYDILFGGAGKDTYYVDSQGQGRSWSDGNVDWWGDEGDLVQEWSGWQQNKQGSWNPADFGGIDKVVSSVSYDLSYVSYIEQLELTGTASEGRGNNLNNLIIGNNEDNYLYGGGSWGDHSSYIAGGGKDTLYGGEGNDTLSGGEGGIDILYGEGGDDQLGEVMDDDGDGYMMAPPATQQEKMYGGYGNDSYMIDSKKDQVFELNAAGENNFSQGTDKVFSYIDYTLGKNVEDLELKGQAGRGTGNELANEITANLAESWQSVQLFGMAGNDTLRGTDSYDYLVGGTGDDWMYGYDGNDEYVVDSTDDHVIEEEDGGDRDEVYSTVSISELFAHVEVLVLGGTAIVGNGNELINSIYGNNLNNILFGGYDNTWDYLDGGGGNDTLIGGNGGGPLIGGTGNDSLTGGTGYFSMDGGAGNDVLRAGNEGSNLDGGTGNDTLYGGLGSDNFYIDSLGDDIINVASGGYDWVYSSVNFTLDAGLSELSLLGKAKSGTGNGANNEISGNTAANILNGLGGDDTLSGYGGNDTLLGGAGNDELFGDAGNDSMVGGAGVDFYVVDSTGDIVVEDFENHNGMSVGFSPGDWVSSKINNYTLTNNVENLMLSEGEGRNGSGNNLNNYILGNDFDNFLDGREGADTLVGGYGDDTYVVDHINDKIEEGQLLFLYPPDIDPSIDAGGIDTVITSLGAYDLSDYQIDGNPVLENLTFTGHHDAIGYGNELDNVMTGDGTTELYGGAGNDVYYVNSYTYNDPVHGLITNLDYVSEELTPGGGGDAGGIDTVITDFTVFSLASTGGNVENLILTGSAVTGIGNGLANQIMGSKMNNVLEGRGGNDLLNGNKGSDSMYGGLGNDTYFVDVATDKVFEAVGEGFDTVFSSSTSFILGAGQAIEELRLTGIGNSSATGNELDNDLFGNSRNNILKGMDGADKLFGGAGNDTLTGGRGSDDFYLSTALNAATNKDTITDFSGTELKNGTIGQGDTITLDSLIFSKFNTTDGVQAGNLVFGTSAAGADDYLIYNQSTGALYYDADGSGISSTPRRP